MSVKSEQQEVAGWQLNENSAEAYEQYLVGRFFRRWADRLVAHAGVRDGEQVLDAGCGTGIVARTVSEKAPRAEVTGLDPNEGMLHEARRQDPGQRVTWQMGALESLPFADAGFDLVLSQQVLQFVPERAAALAEIRRVLAPKGRLVLALLRGLDFNPSYAALAGTLDRHVGRDAGDMMRAPFSGPAPRALRAELQEAGFRDVEIRHDILDVRFPSPAEYLREEAASSPLAKHLGGLDPQTSSALIAELDTVLAPFMDDAGVVFPMETCFVRAG